MKLKNHPYAQCSVRELIDAHSFLRAIILMLFTLIKMDGFMLAVYIPLPQESKSAGFSMNMFPR